MWSWSHSLWVTCLICKDPQLHLFDEPYHGVLYAQAAGCSCNAPAPLPLSPLLLPTITKAWHKFPYCCPGACLVFLWSCQLQIWPFKIWRWSGPALHVRMHLGPWASLLLPVMPLLNILLLLMFVSPKRFFFLSFSWQTMFGILGCK